MMPFFTESFGNPHSTNHVLGWESSQAVDRAAAQVASLIGADAEEIVFTSGATEANNLALLGLAKRVDKNSKRKRFVISAIEHKSILEISRVIERQLGLQVDVLPVDNEGRVSISNLKSVLNEDVLAVSIMTVNNEIGTIQDIKELSRITKCVGALFHSDATQAPVAMDMKWFAEEADMISLSAHKMYGPKGVGALFVRTNVQSDLEPIIYGGGQQNGLRSGTVPTPLCVGMGMAAECLERNDIEAKRASLYSRRDEFLKILAELPYVTSLNGPNLKIRHPGNANICFKGFSGQEILNVLQPNLAASAGSACSSGFVTPSHVLEAIGMSSSDIEASIRFGLGFGTSAKEIAVALDLIHRALNQIRTM